MEGEGCRNSKANAAMIDMAIACVGEKKQIDSWNSEQLISQCCDDNSSLLKNWKLTADENSYGVDETLRPRDIEKIIDALPSAEEGDKSCCKDKLNNSNKPRKAAEIKDKIIDLSKENDKLQNEIKLKGEEVRQVAKAIEGSISNLSKMDEKQTRYAQQFLYEKQQFDEALQSYLMDFNCSEQTAYKVHDGNMEIVYKKNLLACLKLEEERLDKALKRMEHSSHKNELSLQIRLLVDELTVLKHKYEKMVADVKKLRAEVDEKECELTDFKDAQSKACESKIETQKKKLELEQEYEEACQDLAQQNNSIKDLKQSVAEATGTFSTLRDRAMEASCCLDTVSKEIQRKQCEHDELMESVSKQEHLIQQFSTQIAQNEATIEAYDKLKQHLQCQIDEEKKKTNEVARRIKECEEVLAQIRQKQNAMEKYEIKQQTNSFKKLC